MQFLFTTCQIGAENALKLEVTTSFPELRFAYSRPGFLTFKQTKGEVSPGFRLGSVFARVYGASIGRIESVEEVVRRVSEMRPAGSPVRLHVFERDRFRVGEEPPGLEPGALAAGIEAAVREVASREAPGLFLDPTVAVAGDFVLDLVVAPDEPLWAGVHVHSSDHAPWPGGRVPIEVPAEAPSRAYRKLEEARHWFEIPFRQGDIAVEVGSAPGGAALALARLGVRVVGIDPTEMDPGVMGYVGPGGATVHHLRVPVGQVRREELPERVDWLLIDANVAPQVALHTIHRLADRMRSTLAGLLFTLKLNDWRMAAQVPDFLRRVAAMGVAEPRAIQLPSNRQEICVFGLTGKGRRRVMPEPR